MLKTIVDFSTFAIPFGMVLHQNYKITLEFRFIAVLLLGPICKGTKIHVQCSLLLLAYIVMTINITNALYFSFCSVHGHQSLLNCNLYARTYSVLLDTAPACLLHAIHRRESDNSKSWTYNRYVYRILWI